jgi:hemerythrin
VHNNQPRRASDQSDAPSEGLDLSHTDVEIGILIFDVEHRVILDKLHHLYDVMVSGRSQHDVLQSLANLLAISKQHFDHEEDYMSLLKYGDLDKHTEDHRFLISSLEHFVVDLLSEGAVATRNLDKVRSFFGAWHRDHILEHDRTLANFLTQKGIR